jgi:gliding motility-associated-like protein
MFRILCTSIILIFLIPVSSRAQMNIDIQEPMTPAFLNQIIQTLVGNGVYVAPGSVSITGSAKQIAVYSITGPSGDIPFSRGVILSTSEAENISGPDNPFLVLSDQIAPVGGSDPGDALLAQFTSNNTRDAITLQFTFRPQSTPLVFRYGIGTEEYPEFVNNADFNDVFGFFITGQNPAGGTYTDQNIAILPNTQVAGVYNIFSNSTYMIDTQGNGTHQFNAISTAFACSLNVVPCTDYVIKLKICDVSDESYDSAVFLQANSFGSIPVSLNPITSNADSSTFEGCAPATIVASKNDPALLNQDITIPLTIGGSATNGVDYTGLPSSIVIPAGQNSVTVSVNAPEDNLSEPVEDIVITYPSSCGLFDTIVIYIKEKPPVLVTTDDPPSICAGAGPVTITATASSGVAPFTYTWSNAAVGSSTSVNPAATTTYTVTATDFCGGTGTATVTVSIVTNTAPPEVISNSPVCDGSDLMLSCPDQADSYTWSGPGGWVVTGSSATRAAVSPAQTGTYTLQIIKNGCPSAPLNFEVVVFDSNFAPPARSNSPACTGNSILLQAGTPGADQYMWTGPNNFNSTEENPEINSAILLNQGDYTVYFVAGSCTSATATIAVQVNPTPIANAGTDIELCSQQTQDIGSSPESLVVYSWLPVTGVLNPNTSNTQLTPINATSVSQTLSYILTADLNGCKDFDTLTVLVKPVPVAGFPTPTSQCFDGNEFTFNAQGNYPPSATYQWDFGPWASPASASTRSVSGVSFASTGNQPVSLLIIMEGCSSNVFVNSVNVLEMPVANFGASVLAGCEPLLVQFENQSENQAQGLKYLWDFGNGFASNAPNPRIMFSRPGNFRVSLEVTNNSGCKDLYEIPGMISVFPTPVAGFTTSPFETNITEPDIYLDDLSKFADSCKYIITRADGFRDSIETFDGVYTFRDSGTYQVTQYLINQFGCDASFTRSVRVDLGFKLYIPTAFTPNSDDINDFFRVFGEDISDFYIRVYNRWGQMIYQSWDIENGWDGTALIDGKVVPGGVYLYLIRLKDIYGKDYSFDGTVHVLR